MSSWSDERRLNLAAEAAERRKDDDARLDRRRKAREAEDKRRRAERRADRDEKRGDKAQQRRDRAQRRQARAAKREKTLTPGNVYRKGTLLLVVLSALASLPAQIIHFVSISWMLLPVGPALEGAAWVMAAGVAYADERKLPAWVRWLLRGLSMGAAGFAARINYLYGQSLTEHGLTATEALGVGFGLAAVTMGGPLFFEVRQWVLTLSAKTANPKQQADDKARAKHEKKRRKLHKDVAKVADMLVADAPFGTLKADQAWERARHIVYGTTEAGVTPRLVSMAAQSAAALAAAQVPVLLDEKTIRQRILALLHRRSDGPHEHIRYVLPTPPGTSLRVTKSSQVVTDLPPVAKTPEKTPQKAGRRQPPLHRRTPNDSLPFHPLAKTLAADTGRKVAAVNGHHS